MADKPLSLRAYLALTHALPLIAKPVLRRRLGRGKEDPDRWTEKLGVPTGVRPEGKLIWINAVGLGEVLSLRGLIEQILQSDPDVSILVTSTTRDSARVFGQNLPERTIHQFLPIDAPRYRRRFMDHWKPDAAIWAEQDLWPGFVCDLAKRGVPQAVVAARMNAKSFESKNKFRRVFSALYQRMSFITAQDDLSATHLTSLGASDVEVTGSLKPAAPALSHDAATLDRMKQAIGERFVWTITSSYFEDEVIAAEAHQRLMNSDPDALMIIAPRQTSREFGHLPDLPYWSQGELPTQNHCIWMADTIGDLGLFLRLSHATMIGGTFNDIQGHNPWEAANLGVAILHGPKTANFKADFESLAKADAAACVSAPAEIAALLGSGDLDAMGKRAQNVAGTASDAVRALAERILAMQ